MKLTGFGLVLRRITTQDIELVRGWRNQPSVRSQMLVQDEISAEQQVLWFEKINNPFNYYFIIEVSDLPIGVIYAKNIDEQSMVGEGGIFIGDNKFIGTDIPARASMLFLYFCFNKIGVSTSIAKAKEDNYIAAEFNKCLGYKEVKRSQGVIYLQLKKEDFLRAPMVASVLRKIEKSVQLTGTVSDKNLDSINQWLILQG
jgi:RimJ/RimL family protein N-acetyltransferase